MRTLAVVPIKSFAAAKERLGDLLGGGSRKALAQAMLSDVLTSLRRARAVDEIAVVTADLAAETAAAGERMTVLADGDEDGQSAAAAIGIRHARERGFERVLLVPGDTPLLDPAEVDGLLGAGAVQGLALQIVPDRHDEGTNALAISPPEAFEPSFGPGSLARHVAAAEAAGLGFKVERVESLALDVDTSDDLAELGAQLELRRGLAPMTRGALRQLENLRGERPEAAPAVSGARAA